MRFKFEPIKKKITEQLLYFFVFDRRSAILSQSLQNFVSIVEYFEIAIRKLLTQNGCAYLIEAYVEQIVNGELVEGCVVARLRIITSCKYIVEKLAYIYTIVELGDLGFIQIGVQA